MRAALEVRQLGQLLVGDALFSANGRVDVDSKRASRDLRRAYAGESL
jgi:hypothetical protein